VERKPAGLPDFSCYNIPKQEKNKPNGHKIHQMTVKYSQWSQKYQHFPFQSPPKYTQIYIFGMQNTIWQP
jgi:hypothetical protein